MGISHEDIQDIEYIYLDVMRIHELPYGPARALIDYIVDDSVVVSKNAKGNQSRLSAWISSQTTSYNIA